MLGVNEDSESDDKDDNEDDCGNHVEDEEAG